jgi:BMFP domain-containing protein YqiC
MQTEAKGWAAQTRTAARSAVQRLLAELDEVKRESLHQHSQLKQMAEDRRGLQSQLLQMVPRTELSEAMAELARERESKSGLRERLVQLQQENETLVTEVQVG